MTERYEMKIGIRQFKDNKTDKTYCEYNLEDIVDLLNNYEDEIVELKLDIEELKPFKKAYTTDPVVPLLHEKIDKLIKENEHLKGLNQRLKEGILWLLEIICKKDPESDIEFWCQTFFDCNYQTAKEKYGTLSEIMKME